MIHLKLKDGKKIVFNFSNEDMDIQFHGLWMRLKETEKCVKITPKSNKATRVIRFCDIAECIFKSKDEYLGNAIERFSKIAQSSKDMEHMAMFASILRKNNVNINLKDERLYQTLTFIIKQKEIHMIQFYAAIYATGANVYE